MIIINLWSLYCRFDLSEQTLPLARIIPVLNNLVESLCSEEAGHFVQVKIFYFYKIHFLELTTFDRQNTTIQSLRRNFYSKNNNNILSCVFFVCMTFLNLLSFRKYSIPIWTHSSIRMYFNVWILVSWTSWTLPFM